MGWLQKDLRRLLPPTAAALSRRFDFDLVDLEGLMTETLPPALFSPMTRSNYAILSFKSFGGLQIANVAPLGDPSL
jgi:hypothetical protein